MPTLALRFPWKRLHATPWGHYVNEGAVEIPPSPWRILRALYAVWQTRVPDLDEETVHGLLASLAVPPTYVLPPYRVAHTRHYYPDTTHRTGKPSTDKALDAFALLGDDATIYVTWPGELDEPQHKALIRLAEALPYLGRADSLCEASVVNQPPDLADGRRYAVPLGLDAELPPGSSEADLLCPRLPLDIDELIKQPAEIRAAKLLYPPGSRSVPYAVPGPAAASPPPRRKLRPARPVTAVRLALGGTVLPALTETVTLMDTVRLACVEYYNGRGKPGPNLLAGKDADDRPLSGHRHTHYLPLDTDGDRRIEEILLWIPDPGGLPPEQLAALDRLREVSTPERVRGPKKLKVRVAGHGDAATVVPPRLRGPAQRWRSITPFVPPRHRKNRQTPAEFLQAEINRELSAHKLPPAHVTEIPGDWALYTRHRWSPTIHPGETRKRLGTRSDARPGTGLRLEFAQPVTGPISLGTLSHFGLGLFQHET